MFNILDALDCLVNIEELNSLLITDELSDLIDYLWKINHYANLGQINKYVRNSFRNICKTIKNITINDCLNARDGDINE